MVVPPTTAQMSRYRQYAMPALVMAAAVGGYWWYSNKREYDRSLKGRATKIGEAIKEQTVGK